MVMEAWEWVEMEEETEVEAWEWKGVAWERVVVLEAEELSLIVQIGQ